MNTKILLKKDVVAIERAKDAITRNANKLNIFIDMAERELRTTFTNSQKKDICEQGIEFINFLAVSKYKFPDADNDFNEKALGLNLTPLRDYYKTNHFHWERYTQELNSAGIFVPVEIEDLPEVAKHTKYVENKKQEIALKQAKQLSKVLNKMQENGIITPYGHGSNIEMVTDVVKYERIPLTTDYLFAPNLHNISLMK